MAAFCGQIWLVVVFSLTAGDQVFRAANAQNDQDTSCADAEFSSRVLIPHILGNYSNAGRPVKDAKDSIEVTVQLNLWGILDFVGNNILFESGKLAITVPKITAQVCCQNEHSNLLSLHGYFHQTWKDELLVWSEDFPFNCVKYVVLPVKNIWTPGLSIRNSPDGGRGMLFNDKHKIYVTPSGQMDFDPQGQFDVSCQVDFSYYPFDEQVCHIQLESWSYAANQVSVKLAKEAPFAIPPGEWSEHPMWSLVENYSYTKYDEGYNSVIFVMRVQRKPLFYYINVIAPSLIIGAVVIVIFTVPVDLVPKLDVAVTCLVAYTVFQTYVVSDMPKSSANIPLLILYITLQMIYIAGIAICGQAIVFFFIQKGQQDEEFPPRGLTKFCLVVGIGLLVHGARKRLGHNHTDTLHHHEEAHKKGTLTPRTSKVLAAKARDQWIAIAAVFDRILMVLYILAYVITPIVMYHGVPKHKFISHDDDSSNTEAAEGSGGGPVSCYKCGDK